MTESPSTFGPPVIFVKDLDRSRAFYSDVLGLTVVFADDTSVGMALGPLMILLVVVASGEELLGETVTTPRGRPATNVFNLFVNDVDEWYRRLSGRGVDFLVTPIDRPWGRRTAHLRDPDGFVWELSQSIP